MMDKREVSQTHARVAKLFEPVMTLTAPAFCERARPGEFIPSFQENLEGRASMEWQQIPQFVGWGNTDVATDHTGLSRLACFGSCCDLCLCV